MKYFLSFFLLLAITTVCKAQPYRLVLNLSAGKVYNLNGNVRSENFQVFNGQQIKLNVTLSFRVSVNVLTVTDSIYQTEASYQSLGISLQQGNQVIDIDPTKNDSVDVASSLLKAILNKPFNVTITKNGRVKSAIAVEQMIDKVFNSFPQLDSLKKERLKNEFIQTLGAKAFTANMEAATAVFPRLTIGKNDKWAVTTTLASVSTAKVITRYKLVDVTNDFYELNGEGIISSDTTKASTMGGMPAVYNINGTMITTVRIDKVTGWANELKIQQLMNGSVTIHDDPKVPSGTIIPLMMKVNEAVSPPLVEKQLPVNK